MKIQKWLSAALLPSRNNKYHPHLLRPVGLCLVIAALLSINIAQNVTTAHRFQVLGVATSISASEVISLSNQERASNGLPALHTNSMLTSAAEAKAQDMFAKDYWAHFAPDGTSPWDFIHNAGYVYSTAGENLAKGFDTSADVVQGWMNSAPHRANVLSSAFVDTGIAVMNGTLQGEETTLVVAEYGAPQTSISNATTKPSTPAQAKPKTTAPAVSAPAPAPAATPATETPVPTTAPAVQPKAAKPVTAQNSTAQPRTISEQSVSARTSRTWAQNATLLLLSTLFLVSVLKHTIVWRTRKKGWRHIWLRAHPAAQYALLMVAIVANLVSGAGVIR